MHRDILDGELGVLLVDHVELAVDIDIGKVYGCCLLFQRSSRLLRHSGRVRP